MQGNSIAKYPRCSMISPKYHTFTIMQSGIIFPYFLLSYKLTKLRDADFSLRNQQNISLISTTFLKNSVF
jgi:hypothetical protein